MLLGAKAGILILAWNHPGAAVTVLKLHLKNGADQLILGKQDKLHQVSEFTASKKKVSEFTTQVPHGNYQACFENDFVEKRRIR